MQPEYQQPQPQPQPTPNPSLDYLNQIAAPAQQKTLNPLVLWAAIIGVVIVAISVVLLLAASSSGASGKDTMSTLAVELSALQDITTDATENIQGSELRTLNSSLSLVLANINRDSTDAVSAIGATTDEKNKLVVEVNSQVNDVKSKLEDARLNGIFDRAYAREMTYYLKTVRTEMSGLYQQTKNQTVHDFLVSADENLAPFVKDFSSYNAD